MTRMVPPTIHSSVRSGAERRIFKVIETAPRTKDWVCLHSLGLARHVSKRRGEIDFVVICPQGVFVLEVKGGKVRREEGIWTFTNKYGETFRKSEGPFDQAASAMFTLEKEVKREFSGSPLAKALFGYGVVIPDVAFEEVGCEADPSIVYDVRDRTRPFDSYIVRLAEFTRGVQSYSRKGLKKNQVDALVEFLRTDFDLVPTVSTIIEDTNKQLAELTKQQFAVLDSLESHARVLVEGVAGSGKTLLALESARRNARQGYSVLFLCYNRNLAARIKAIIETEKYLGCIDVRTVHGHCRALIKESSLEGEFLADCERHPLRYQFDELYPAYGTLAMYENVERPCDVLIVDEAQDVLTSPVVELMGGSVKGGLESGNWQIYLDSNNQASIYGRMDESVLDQLKPFAAFHVLTVNCRNTKQIAQHTAVLSGANRQVAALAAGPPVEYLVYGDPDGPIQPLREILTDLRNESVHPGRIVVLFPKKPNSHLINEFGRMGMVQLELSDMGKLGSEGDTDIFWSPVSGFKGLESDVVIMVGVENIQDDWWKAVTYVGMSRARTRLFVILNKVCEPTREKRLEELLRREFAEGDVEL